MSVTVMAVLLLMWCMMQGAMAQTDPLLVGAWEANDSDRLCSQDFFPNKRGFIEFRGRMHRNTVTWEELQHNSAIFPIDMPTKVRAKKKKKRINETFSHQEGISSLSPRKANRLERLVETGVCT